MKFSESCSTRRETFTKVALQLKGNVPYKMVAMDFWDLVEVYWTESWLAEVMDFDENIFLRFNTPHWESDPVEPYEEHLEDDEDGWESGDEYYTSDEEE